MNSIFSVVMFLSLLSTIQGTVVDQRGLPMSGIPVVLEHTGDTVSTDAEGKFVFAVAPGNYTLGFYHQSVEVTFRTEAPVSVIFPGYSDTLTIYPGAAEEFVYEQDRIATSGGENISEFLSRQPETHLAGIGGALSVISIGGLSKHRIQTTLNGFRISGDRRAGSDLGTVIPNLVERVKVFRGGTGTSFGSEAMGGVLDVKLPNPEYNEQSTRFDLQYSENNARTYVGFISNFEDVALGAAYDDASCYHTPDGSAEDGFYTRYNAFTSWRMPTQKWSTSMDLFFSEADDVGKPSTSSKITVYPEYNLHLLGFHAAHDNVSMHVGGIYQKLRTERAGEYGLVESYNLHTKALYRIGQVKTGFEVYTRQKVNSENVLDGVKTFPLDDASKWEIAPILSFSTSLFNNLALDVGGRFQYFTADNKDDRIENQFFFTYYSEFSYDEVKVGRIGLSLFRSYRFPTIEELFYTGITARGYIIGNQDLEPEDGFGGRLAWQVRRDKWQAHLSYQVQEVQNFIQKYKAKQGPDNNLYSFQNVGEARIQDAVLSITYDTFHLGVSWAEGQDTKTGTVIDDIPPFKMSFQGSYPYRKFTPRFQILYVDLKDDIGPSEQKIPAYTLVDASISYSLAKWLELTGKVTNILNEEYFPSADEKAVHAPGRSFSLGLSVVLPH